MHLAFAVKINFKIVHYVHYQSVQFSYRIISQFSDSLIALATLLGLTTSILTFMP